MSHRYAREVERGEAGNKHNVTATSALYYSSLIGPCWDNETNAVGRLVPDCTESLRIGAASQTTNQQTPVCASIKSCGSAGTKHWSATNVSS